MASGVSALAVVVLVLHRRFRPFRVEVHGESMAPTLQPGDWLIAIRTRPWRLRPGIVVVARPPTRPGLEVVKRLTAGPGDVDPTGGALAVDQWFLSGDRPAASTDSRHFGPISSAAVTGRVVAVYWPPRRIRLVCR
jgi:nickel-type superoxide dismutase maturation protease